ncbi:MAG: VOC family protein [Chloroflexi bacterium]|nr:VOC family protein [Chloroflexota bacterium]
MHIEHVAIWTHDLERLKDFYARYFNAVPSAKYTNSFTQFESYFLTFETGARLELMQMPGIAAGPNGGEQQFTGYNHLAFSVGSQEAVDALTEQLRRDGYPVIGEPRRTGDGYYESVILDPDGNRVEITI